MTNQNSSFELFVFIRDDFVRAELRVKSSHRSTQTINHFTWDMKTILNNNKHDSY